MADEWHSIVIRIALPANRDYEGVVAVEARDGAHLAGPFRIAARAADDIAAAHGNPTRATTLPFGDPPLGLYRLQAIAPTGEGTRYRQDLFGTQDVLVLNGMGGHAALADANGRFEIVIHGGPLAADGGLRASSGHFRVRDADLAVMADLARRSRETRCICEPVPGEAAPLVATGELRGGAERGRPTPERIRARPRPRPAVAWDYLVAFGEYSADDGGVDVSLNSPLAPPTGQGGQASMGIANTSDSMQLGGAQSLNYAVDPYTGLQPQPSPLTFDPYPGGPGPFYPWGQPANAFNGATGAPTTAPTGAPTTAPSGAGAGPTGPSAGIGAGSGSPSPATPLMFPFGPAAVGLQPYLPGGGQGSSPFIAGGQGANPGPSSAGPPRNEVPGAWSGSSPSPSAWPAIREAVRMGFQGSHLATPDLAGPGTNIATAVAEDPRAIDTAIRPFIAEVSGYDARLALLGQTGTQAPTGSNVPGADYKVLASGQTNIIADNKSRVTPNSFGRLNVGRQAAWAQASLSQLSGLNRSDPRVQQSLAAPNVFVRDTVDYSNRGQGRMQLAGVNVPIDPALPQPVSQPSLPRRVGPPVDPAGSYVDIGQDLNKSLSQTSMSGSGVATLVGTMINAALPSMLNLGENGTQALWLAVQGASEWIEMVGPAAAGTALTAAATSAPVVGPAAGVAVAGAVDAVGAAFGSATVSGIAGLGAGAIGVAASGVALAGAAGYVIGTEIQQGMVQSGLTAWDEGWKERLGIYDLSYRIFFK